MSVEFTFGRVLKDHVDSRVIVEVAVQSQNVRVSKVRLNFDFASELMFATGFLHLVLKDDLEGDHVSATLLPGQVDVAEFALAQRFADLEVV